MLFQSLDESRAAFEETMMRKYRVQRRVFARLPAPAGDEYYAFPYVNQWWKGWREAITYVEDSRQETQR